MDNQVEQVLAYCPEQLRQTICEGDYRQLEEIRLRRGQPVCVNIAGREWALQRQGKPLIADGEMIKTVLGRACSYSGYAVTDQLSQGYLTVKGGHRIGVCGTLRPNGTMTDFTSLNIRIARQVRGFAEPAYAHLKRQPGSTLILGPPGSGKTTLLRELVRCLSDGMGCRVSLIDERCEVAGAAGGEPGFSVGRHTDILTGTAKGQGIGMALRSMNPQWIALDEVTAPADAEAMVHAAHCGVFLLATAHGACPADLHRRTVYRQLLAGELFENLITITPDRQIRAERIGK